MELKERSSFGYVDHSKRLKKTTQTFYTPLRSQPVDPCYC